MAYTARMPKYIAAFIAFTPAVFIGWLLGAWLPAILAGAVAFLLLWPLAALIAAGVDGLLGAISTRLPFPRDP